MGPDAPVPIDGSEPDRPKGEYDRQKLRAERALLAADAAGTLRGAALRLPTVVGPAHHPGSRDKGVALAMIDRALAGEPVTMWHDGTVRRDLLPVGEVARAVVAAVDHLDALAGRHWTLGSGAGSPLGEVFTTVAALAARRTGGEAVPVVSVEPPAYAESSDFRDVVVDASAFRSVTGWRPASALAYALAETVDHRHARRAIAPG
ncbi:NAD-dependent epimerase/dehydratase family protein [Streptomyces lonarensis]|uniref:NAD-dependent epimerase/dehydratase family protein n=1 Tax=Streptomyces lonarensis TaxID=700599 RepID=UPI0028ADA95D|nr:NAD-dependent epimerase/dehydratase family protein [Streptomyces lonarensis]